MSDHPREAQRRLSKIFVCDDIWLSTFPSLGPAVLGLKLALLSDRFDTLVDLHFKKRKWTLGELKIQRFPEGNGAAQIAVMRRKVIKQLLPIPQQPLPDNIIGFKHIWICTIDHTAIAFLHLIRRLFSADTMLRVCTNRANNNDVWGEITRNIWPLMVNSVGKLKFKSRNRLNTLRIRIAPNVLRNLANLRTIVFDSFYFYRFNPLWPDDRAEAPADRALSKWLHTPREDGRPKVLKFNDHSETYFPNAAINHLKEEFRNASTSASYIVVLCCVCAEFDEFEPFELINRQTRERFALELAQHDMLLLRRSPIERDEAKWAEGESEATKKPLPHHDPLPNSVTVDVQSGEE
uniref:Uncharacterized protein n=1 Tax=Globodera rostochiensis TaxID=31243 RepID=A0A914HKN8_GLORO